MAIRIKNWHQFQHFKDRRPPWVKLYRDILDDIQWHELPPPAAKTLVMLWLIASEYEGALPDMKTLSFRLRLSETQTKTIVSSLSHWLEQDDIAAISAGNQSDPLETETEKRQSKRQRQTALPTDFKISERVKAWAEENHHANLEKRLEHFVGYARRSGKTYADWDEAFMSAIRENWAKIGLNGNGVELPKPVKVAPVNCYECSDPATDHGRCPRHAESNRSYLRSVGRTA